MTTNKFAERLKKLRQDKKLTQKELAESIGETQGKFTKWENGTLKPNFDKLIALSWELDTSIDYLLGASDSNYGREHSIIAPTIDLETAYTALENLELTKELQGLTEKEYNHQKSSLQKIINDWKNWQKKTPHENNIGTKETKPNETNLNDL